VLKSVKYAWPFELLLIDNFLMDFFDAAWSLSG
jgi:hypothetical protein